MAEALLKSWNAPALVSSVQVDAQTGKVEAQNAKVTGIQHDKSGTLKWTARENALPFPIAPPDPGSAAAFQLAVASSTFIETLDQEPLKVTNLAAPRYTLKIDNKSVGEFSREALAAGINLATLPTPMLAQAQLVARLTQLRSNVHNSRWREYHVPQASDPQATQYLPKLLSNLESANRELTKAQRDAAQPRAHTFVLEPKG